MPENETVPFPGQAAKMCPFITNSVALPMIAKGDVLSPQRNTPVLGPSLRPMACVGDQCTFWNSSVKKCAVVVLADAVVHGQLAGR